MNKREFIRAAGLFGISSMIPFGRSLSQSLPTKVGDCVLIPTETAGPFPLDLSTNTYYFRQDVRETKTGIPLYLKFKIIGEEDCLPMKNVRVNIWHCDKDGKYSGYDDAINPGQAGQTYLRGYQITDVNG
jgi:protocatechuate 3,4-dioxygenase beta subunit